MAWKDSQDSWSYQRRANPCTRCGHPVHPSLAIIHEGSVYCADCVKAISLSSRFEDLDPREGESMEDWLVRWRGYRERCINDELARLPAGPKKKVRFKKAE